jgi:hypothetical protein
MSVSISKTTFFHPSRVPVVETNCSRSFDPVTFVKNTCQQSAEIIHWFIQNRGGLAKVAGVVMVPAQYLAKDYFLSNKIINKCLLHGLKNGKIEKIAIPLGDRMIQGVICYPKNWKKEDNSRCIVYHNPNGLALADFFQNQWLQWTPREIFEVRKCPMIFYDYRGVGLNQDVNISFPFHATYESIVEDGQAALKYALKTFDKVEVMGSSLGGGVATASLDRHLTRYPLDKKRIIQLVNHDSFTTTPRVLIPKLPGVADSLGNLIGANLDAMTPIKNLIDRGLKVKVLYHEQDWVIPFGARMGDAVKALPKKNNVTVFKSPYYGHANLSKDMLAVL